MPIITKLQVQKRNPQRLNLFLDGRYAFALDLEQVFKHHLDKGQLLSPEQIVLLQYEAELDKLFQKMLNFLSYRPRSKQELKLKLQSYLKSYTSSTRLDLIQALMSKLESKGLVNDQEFALWFIRQRMQFRPRSRRFLIQELRAKGLDLQTIETALDQAQYNEIEALNKLISKHSHYSPKRLQAYLLRQGFSYSLIQEFVHGEQLEGSEP